MFRVDWTLARGAAAGGSFALGPSILRQAQEAQGRLQPSPAGDKGRIAAGVRPALPNGRAGDGFPSPYRVRGRLSTGTTAMCAGRGWVPVATGTTAMCAGCWPRLARLGGGAGSDPDFEPVGPGDAGLAHPVGGPLYPDALALRGGPGFAGAASPGAKSFSNRPGICRSVLPDVLAV